ncbi:MAG: hypothetical protein AB7O50_07860 [Pseudolabrys sp.]
MSATTALFRPTPRAAIALVLIACAALGAGMYVRYVLVEQPSVGLACQAGLENLPCTIRKHAIALFTQSVFGGAAVVIAVLNLARPSLVLFVPALALAGLGIVLYNVNLSALAVALLMLSLARRAPEPE